MDESALLSNIAMIITKDILVDESSSLKQPKHFLWHSNESETDVNANVRFPLLEPADNDDEDFFLKQQLTQQKSKPKKDMPTTSQKPSKKRKFTQKQDGFSRNDQKLRTSRPKLVSKHSKELNLLNEFENHEFEGYLHMSKMSFLVSFLLFLEVKLILP